MEVEKHIIITGSSNISWKDAIVRTIDEASKTLENLTEIKVLSQSAKILSNKIATCHFLRCPRIDVSIPWCTWVCNQVPAIFKWLWKFFGN